MSKHLERLGPVLSLIPGVNIPAALLQSAYIAASQRKIEQLEQALKYEIGLANQKLVAAKISIAEDYIRSDAFEANFLQALRATEIAESAPKIYFIARSLVGCALEIPEVEIDKCRSMRIVESLSEIEMHVFIDIFKRTYLIEAYSEGYPRDSELVVSDLSRWQIVSSLISLEKLGLFTRDTPQYKDGEWLLVTPRQYGDSGFIWIPTSLARQVAALSRILEDEKPNDL